MVRAFSMIEVVIVVAIIGVIAAIAIPRFTSGSENARRRVLEQNLVIIQKAVDLYEIEHGGDSPAHPAGVLSKDEAEFFKRLTRHTDVFGAAGQPFGPYLRGFPTNPFNDLKTFRIDGAAAGANTHGWRFDSTERIFAADDSVENAAVKPGSKVTGDVNLFVEEAGPN